MVKDSYFLGKKGLREITSNWKQFLSMLFIGTIAVTLFVGLTANAQSLDDRVNETYEKGNMADLWVTVTGVDEDDKAAIERITGGEVEGRYYYYAALEATASYIVINSEYPEISKPWNLIKTATDFTYNDFLIVDEALTCSSVSGTSVITLGSEVDIGFSLPDIQTVKEIAELMEPYVAEGKTNIFDEKEITLVGTVNGIMQYPENITIATYQRSAFLCSERTFVSMMESAVVENYTVDGWAALLEYLLDGGSSISDAIPLPYQYVVVLPDGADEEALKDEISDYFQAKEDSNLQLVAGRDLMPFSSSIEAEVDNARSLTYIFPVVFFIVAILVILTTSSQIILKERTIIGSMRAIGISKGSIYLHYMSLVGGVVLLGTVIGEILGPFLLPFIMGQKYNILYSLPSGSIFPFPVLTGILTGVLFIGLAALVTFLAAYKTVKMMPASSMRPSSPHIKGMKGLKSRFMGSPLALSCKIALRNIRTNIVKSLMVVIGIMGCTMLLVAGFGIEDTINNSIDNDLNIYYNSELEVSYVVPKTNDDIQNEIAGITGVSYVQSLSRDTTELSKPGIEDAGYDTVLYVFEGDAPYFNVSFDSDKCLITTKVAQEYSLLVGDSIEFTSGGDSYTVEIQSIHDFFSANGVFMHSDFFQSGSITYMSAFVYVEDGVDSNTVKAELEGASIHGLGSVITHEERVSQINDIVSGIMIMTTAVKTFAILLAVVVLYNLALLNFRERIRDIATLKVLGFSRGEISMSLLLETMTLTALGVAGGLALGDPFMDAVLMVNKVPLVYFMNFVSPWTYLIAFALTFVLAFLVNMYLSLLTKKVRMVESLKSVE